MNVKQLAKGALIGALYAVLTIVAPISMGAVQFRVSEALTVLPYYTAAAAPGLFVGCVIANIIMGGALYDIIFGSLATLTAAVMTRAMHKLGWSRYLAPLPAVVVNAFVVGAIVFYVYGMNETATYWACVGYVAVGQVLSCYLLGIPLMLLLDKYGARMKLTDAE